MNQLKKFLPDFLLLLALLPLFGLNMGHHHDWGGDFALYIQQAINLMEGIPQAQTQYIHNPYFLYLSPPSYGVGFPLMLAPVYALFGNNIAAFLALITATFIVFLLFMYRYLRIRFGVLESFLVTVAFSYTPLLLRFKGEVLSDFPFAMVICICLLLYGRFRLSEKVWPFISIGALIGFSMLTRTIGFLLVAAIVIDRFSVPLSGKAPKRKKSVRRFLPAIAALVSCLALYVAMGTFIFPARQESVSFFSELFQTDNLGNQIREGLEYYFFILEQTFNPDGDKWQFISTIFKSFVIAMLVVGFVKSLAEKTDFSDYFFILYMGTIVVFPVYSQGFRYLIPVFPIAARYILIGFGSISLKLTFKRPIIYAVTVLSIYLIYKKEVEIVDLYYPQTHNGPHTDAAKEVFTFLREKSNPEAIVVFQKPRVLGLYAQRDCYALYPEGNLNTTRSQLWDLGWDYLLECTELEDKQMQEYLRDYKQESTVVFTNEKFTLRRRK